MEKKLKLQELLQQSSEERKEQDVQFEVKQAELQLSSDILATEKSLAEAMMKKTSAILSKPFDSQAIINLDIQIESLEDGLKRLNTLKEDLF
jgi:hypothetical protein